MHTTTSRGGRRARAAWSLFVKFFSHESAVSGLDATILEDRTLYSATPLMLAAVDLDVQEAAEDMPIRLADLFGSDDPSDSVQHQLLDSSGPVLLDYAQELSISADLVNNTPTMKNLQNFTVTDAVNGVTTIDLFGAFDDEEDADQDLTFRVANNSNPSLFTSTTIDMDRGLLILRHAEGRGGSAQLTITATDTGGLTVGFDTPRNFKVYDEIHSAGGKPADAIDLGLHDVTLMTHWYFFTSQSNGTYDFSKFDAEKFTRALTAYSVDPSVPVVFDIENDYYVNTPEGRDRFAEVFALANQLRPDLEIGLYRFMPERSYHHPVKWDLTQQHRAMGIETWYTAHGDEFQSQYEDWLARSELYRTEPVSAQYGGKPLSNMIDAVNPSLYTFYRNRENDPVWRAATLSSATDRFSVDGPSFDTVDAVRIRLTADGVNSRLGLSQSLDYYVINVQGNTFQVSTTPGGPPIDFTSDSVGDVFIGAKGPWENLWHDPDVLSWKAYAEQNVAEARKFGKPVYAWVSPSIAGTGAQYLEYDFFRWQLETLRPIVDGIMIYEPATRTRAQQEQQGWFAALADFMDTLEQPAGTVTVSVSSDPTGGNQIPVANNDSLSAVEDQSLSIAVSRLLANDVDADGDSLQFHLGDGPQHGTLSQQANGMLVYRPNANFQGVDQFTYTVTDGTATSAQPATVTLNVAPVNDRPVAKPDRFNVVGGQVLLIDSQDLLKNDVDVDGDALSVQIDQGPRNGRIVELEDGRFRYIPSAAFVGTDQFTYRVTDGNQVSEPAVVTIGVDVDEIPLLARADSFAVVQGQHLVVRPEQLLANDQTDSSRNVQVELVDAPTHGRVRWTLNGSIVYVPGKDYRGLDRFHYRVTDGENHSEIVAVNLEIKESNERPVGRPDVYRMAQGTVLRVSDGGVLANDTDVDSDDLRALMLKAPRHGTLLLKRDGTFVYRPRVGFAGLDMFEYRVVDEQGNAAVARAVIRVAPLNVDRDEIPRLGEVATTREVREPVGGNGPKTPPVGEPTPPIRPANGPIIRPITSANAYSDILRQLGMLRS